MSVPQITVDLTPPSIGQSVEEFNAQAHIWTGNLQTGFQPQANALATFVNQKAVDANDDATAAANAKTAAESARDTAITKAGEASTSATTAGNAKTAAESARDTAITKAGEASTSATTASNAKTAAESARDTAITKAGEASTSATAAGNAKTSAESARDTAITKAGEASTSATAAGTAKTAAESARDTAITKAGEASASASAALASKNAAALSQADAYQSKLDAEAAAQQAAGGGEPTILPGTNAQYWRGDKTWQTLDKSAVGLSNVDNTSDANKPVSNATATALDAKADLVGGKIPESQIPAVAITDVFTVGSQAAMLALVAQRGDIAVRSDLNKSFALAAEPASTLANWVELRTPTDAVLSVNSKTGAVTLSAADVGAEAAFTAGTSAQYRRGDKTWRDFATDVRDSVLTGLSTATRRAIADTDSVLTALGILEASKVNRQDSYAPVTSGVINLGLETELYHITVSGNVTVSVSNAPTTARVVKRLIVQYSSGVLTWPASFRLPTPMPTFAAGKAYVFSIEQSPNSGVYFLVPGPEYTYP